MPKGCKTEGNPGSFQTPRDELRPPNRRVGIRDGTGIPTIITHGVGGSSTRDPLGSFEVEECFQLREMGAGDVRARKKRDTTLPPQHCDKLSTLKVAVRTPHNESG